MAEDINLLPEVSEAEKKKNRQNRSINFVAIVSLLVVGVILLGLFGYWVFLAANAQRIQSQTEEAEKEIIQNNRKEITHRALVDKLENAKEFVQSAVTYSAAYNKLFKFLGDSKSELKASEVKGQGDISVTVEMKNTKPLLDFTNKILDSSQQQDFGNVTLVSLRKDKDKPYQFIVSAKYLKKGLTGEAQAGSSDQ